MRLVLQRSLNSRVKVEEEIVGSIDKGLVILVGFTEGDNSAIINYMVEKVINLRIFDDEKGIMNKSLLDIGGSILSISQFTLYGDASHGRRPTYIRAMNGDKARELYCEFNDKLKDKKINVETGIFGADMQVELINDGPVTIILEKENRNGEK